MLGRFSFGEMTMNLTKQEETMLLQNSLERVINNAIFVGTKAMASKNPDTSERAYILVDDCEAMRSLASRLWNDAREEVIKARIRASSP